MLSKRVQGLAARCAVGEAIDKMLRQKRFRSTRPDLESETFEGDLRYLALALGRNTRRRLLRDKRREAKATNDHDRRVTERSSISSEEHSTTEASGAAQRHSSDEATPIRVARVAHRRSSVERISTMKSIDQGQQESDDLSGPMLFVQRQGEAVGRIDFLDSIFSIKSFDCNSTPEKPKLAQFMKFLTTDFAFVPDRDLLISNSDEVGKIMVSNEMHWRAVCVDMRMQGRQRYQFSLERKG